MSSQTGGALRRAVLLAVTLAGLVFVPLAGSSVNGRGNGNDDDHGNGGPPRIEVLSNRADLISGGDALVQVVLSNKADPASVSVRLNGTDITSAFAVRPNGAYEGLVTGLAVGKNDLTATAPKGPPAHITITNHPSGGPVFAGPQVQPWICKTVAGFPAPTDAQCDAAPAYSYAYMDAGTHTFKAYDPSSPPPAASIATTTTDQSVTVPYIVRLERGAMDRGLYDVAVLDNPSASWSPWASQPGWNHKVLYQFGGGTAPWHTNGAPQNDLIDLALSRGFLVANNNLNIRGDDANDVVSAEALMMLKEHIVESYGPIRYTIGTGCSGGSIQQYQIAANYPGLLNGIQPNCSFQDSWTTANEVNDCHLLRHYFAGDPSFSTAEQAAVMDVRDPGVCTAWDLSFAPVGIPSRVSNCNLQGTPLASQVYPSGPVRCTVQDYQSAIWGFRPQDGFARSPYSNVGIQYGLNALNAGTITPQQFVNLNAGVGGTDIDLNFTAARTGPDLVAQKIAYRTGQVTNARELANVPIIDLRGSEKSFNDIHTDYHSYVLRARLDAANHTHANQLIWTWDAALTPTNITPPPSIALQSFLTIDKWLSNIESDTGHQPLRKKVIADKPSGATDECFLGATLTPSTDPATCATAFPHYGDARLAAGESTVDNAMACRLEALDPSSYHVAFTSAQWTALQAAFPNGVCDWNAPPVGWQPHSIPWLTYANGPGGTPLGHGSHSHSGLHEH
jgi:Tannase-like family of unknown function (DUF6351)